MLVELDSMLAQLSEVDNLGEKRLQIRPLSVRKRLGSAESAAPHQLTLKMVRESAFFVTRCRQRCVRLERLLAVRESRFFSRSHTAYWNVTWGRRRRNVIQKPSVKLNSTRVPLNVCDVIA